MKDEWTDRQYSYRVATLLIICEKLSKLFNQFSLCLKWLTVYFCLKLHEIRDG